MCLTTDQIRSNCLLYDTLIESEAAEGNKAAFSPKGMLLAGGRDGWTVGEDAMGDDITA